MENIGCCLVSTSYFKGIVRGLLLSKKKVKENEFSIGSMTIKIPFSLFRPQFKSIFIQKEYATPRLTPSKILDIGANYGMSILYFKNIYPDSVVTAYEADPYIYKILCENISNNQIDNVDLVNKAAWVFDGELNFSSNRMAGGSVSISSEEESYENVTVSCEDIAKRFADETFDIIKMDIEGGEFTLIPHIEELIKRTKCLIFECHSLKNISFELVKILEVLDRNKFKYYIRNEDDVVNPFIDVSDGPFSNRLVVYCERLAE